MSHSQHRGSIRSAILNRPLRWLFSFFLAMLFAAQASAREYDIAAVPAWVKPVSLNTDQATSGRRASQTVDYLLADFQTQLGKDGKTSYSHLATKAVNEHGLEKVGHISITFDPGYQSLTLHSLIVHRAGKATSRLDTANIRVLQREKELEYRIYDGSKTVDISLDDIRTGDTVEYAYTIRGSNPVFANRLAGGFELQWTVPVHAVHVRLLAPKNRTLHVRMRNTSLTAEPKERGDFVEYEWHLENQPALDYDSDAPGWYDPFPAVEWSEFKEWQEVAAWALPLYRIPDRLDRELEKEASRIMRVVDEPADRIMLALRFVQSEIRYLGIEIGASSHAPTAPGTVLKRRFGDCKDKALLMVAMLRALGYEAEPALVNTGVRKGVPELQPAPGAFNHVIVRVRLDGKSYWLDPTLSTQEGDLQHVRQPDYGHALPVLASGEGLVAMTEARASDINRRTIHSLFDASRGMKEPARMIIRTRYEGRAADTIRNSLASERPEELQKAYLNFYTQYYPGISVATPFTVEEGKTSNHVEITEQYDIPDVWKRNEEKKRRQITVSFPDIEQYLKRPADMVRHSPYVTAHPIEIRQDTEVVLHEDWNIEGSTTAVDNAAFSYKRRVRGDGRKIFFSDEMRSLADHVVPADMKQYAADLERARDELDYVIYQADTPANEKPASSGFNWLVAIVALFFLAVWIWLARKVYRYDPPPAKGETDPTLCGISGWLLLPALGIIVSPLRLLLGLYNSSGSFAPATWNMLTTPGSEQYHMLWAPTLLFELASNIGQVVFWILLGVLFFKARRVVPRLYIGLLCATPLLQLADIALVASFQGAAGAAEQGDIVVLVRSVFSLCLWGAYFMTSKRVRSTFVNTWATKADEPAAPAVVNVEVQKQTAEVD